MCVCEIKPHSIEVSYESSLKKTPAYSCGVENDLLEVDGSPPPGVCHDDSLVDHDAVPLLVLCGPAE